MLDEKGSSASKAETRWAIVGRATAVVGILVGLTTLIKTATEPRGHLIAHVTASDVAYPPDAERNISAALAQEQIHILSEWNRDQAGRTKLQDLLKEHLVDEFIGEVLSAGLRSGSIYTIRVENTGDNTLKNVRLNIHASVYAVSIQRSGKQLETLPARLETSGNSVHARDRFGDDIFVEEVALGDMPPHAVAQISAWSLGNTDIEYVGRGMTLVHDSGIGRIRTPKYSLTPYEWLRREWQRNPRTSLTLVLVGLASFAGMLWRRHRRVAA